MQVSLIISIIGPDKAGLVKSLSETLNHFQGNWTESRMSHLAGRIAIGFYSYQSSGSTHL